MNKINVSYERVYTDDSGKKTLDTFKGEAEVLSCKMLWAGIVDGFCKRNNTNILVSSLTGNIRIVVVSDETQLKLRFEQYFLTGMDGKVVEIPANTKYAIQNIDEGKSTYIVGSIDTPNNEYYNKSIFNWRKKQP